MSVPPAYFSSSHPTPSPAAPSYSSIPFAASAAFGSADAASAPIVVFCHLTWDGVWQRPQQFLSRLAQTHPVLFVETYCSDVPSSRARAQVTPRHPRVTVLQMQLPAARWSDGAFIDAERRRLLLAYLRGEGRGFSAPVLWFYDPMAVVAFAGHCGERAIIYDCMDELSQFRGAPPELVARERQLLAVADVVFCGGRKMRDKRLPLNPHSHFYGTGVDCAHFGAARTADLPVDPQIAALAGKVLGYFGVIDERIDYELLAKLADRLPQCSIAMVGPTAKVNPADFPQRRNLHWLGRRDYADLPAITKGFAVCLMPFALNEATEFINPTKALEYMATGRPIVSTALDEVKLNFGSVCRIARSHDEFIAQCAQEADHPNRARIRRGLALTAQNTWDAIAAQMDAHLVAAVQRRAGRAAASPGSASKVAAAAGGDAHV